MTHPTPAATPQRPSSPAPWLAAALLVAFSPVLVELARNLLAEPGDRWTMLGLGCFAWLLWCEGGRPAARRRPALGAAVLGAALALELLGIAAASWSIARLALPLAVVGLAIFAGWPRVPAALVAFAAIPLPDTVVGLASPAAERGLAAAVAAGLAALGAEVRAVGFSLVAPAGRIDLGPGDLGLPLAVVLAAAGWTRALLRGAPPAAWVASALAGAAVGFVATWLDVLLAAALLSGGSLAAARVWTGVVFPAAVVVGVAWALLRARGRARPAMPA